MTVRVELPAHLRTLAGISGELRLSVESATVRAVLDALERQHPTLRGTIRDRQTGQRRAFLRFFAEGRDLSHEGADAALPQRVQEGAEPLLVIGAISGG